MTNDDDGFGVFFEAMRTTTFPLHTQLDPQPEPHAPQQPRTRPPQLKPSSHSVPPSGPASEHPPRLSAPSTPPSMGSTDYISSSSTSSTTAFESFIHIMAVVTRTLSYSLGSILLLLALLAPRSRKARFYLNVALYTCGLGACSVWGVIVSVLMSLIPGQRLNINKVIARSFYYLTGSLTGIRFIVEGEENFEKARPAVLVGNHQSSIDILYLGAIFPAYAAIMAKKELKYAPLLGQYMTLSGAVFIDRKNRKDAVKSMDQVGNSMKKRNLSLWIFPEGTRSNLPVPDLLPFKKGAFHLAIQAQVPVIPVVCENYYRLFDSKSRFDSGTIRIKVLPPIPTAGMAPSDAATLSDTVREKMLETLRAFDADQERADTGMITSNSASLSPSQAAQRTKAIDPLGGVAKLASYIVGRGSGTDWSKKVERDRAAMTKPGTSGLQPSDYGLVSEGQKDREDGTSSAVQTHASG